MKKRILFILLSICMCLSGCGRDEEVASNTEIITLQPNRPEQSQESSQQANQSSTNKKPSQSKDNSIAISKQEVTFDFGDKNKEENVVEQEVIEERPTVEQLQEEEKVSKQIEPEEVLELVKTSMPNNYSYELIGTATRNGGVLTLNQNVSVADKLVYEEVIDNLSGSKCLIYNTWYDYANHDLYRTEDGYTATEKVGVTYNTISSILNNIKYSKFKNLDMNSNLYNIECGVGNITLNDKISFNECTANIFVDKLTNNIQKIELRFSETFLNKNNYSEFSIEIHVGNYNNVSLTLPEKLTTVVDEPPFLEYVSNMLNNINCNNYSLDLRYNDGKVLLNKTNGNVYQKVSNTVAGVPENIEEYYNALSNKTYTIKVVSSLDGTSQLSEVSDGIFNYFDLCSFLNALSNLSEIRSISSEFIAFTANHPDIVINDSFSIPSNKCAVHIRKSTGNVEYVEFYSSPDNLTDNELSTSKTVITVYNVNGTDVKIPQNMSVNFDELRGE